MWSGKHVDQNYVQDPPLSANNFLVLLHCPFMFPARIPYGKLTRTQEGFLHRMALS